MQFKLILALAESEKVDAILQAAREAGATGCTVITNARGEGLKPRKTFLGLELALQRDIVLFVVEEHLSRHILEKVAAAGRFEEETGSGIALQIDIEDAIGLGSQIQVLSTKIGDQL